MYGPAPPRTKKTSITRSRSACQACRARRRKCDEAKPRCGHCERQKIECLPYTQALKFQEVTFEQPRSSQGPHSELNNRPDEVEEISISIRPPEQGPRTTESYDFGDAFANGGKTDREVLFDSERQTSIFGEASAIRGSNISIVGHDAAGELPPPDQGLGDFTMAGRAIYELTDQSDDNLDWISESNQVVDCVNWDPPPIIDLKLRRSPGFSWGGGHQQTFYMNVWDNQCLLALHPAFRQFGILDNAAPIVQDAILSLSACHMSRLLPQRKALTASDIPGLAYRPEFHHQVASQEYYQSATKKLREWAGNRDASQLNSMLAAMILFCSLESSMGNFTGFNIHFNGVNTLLQMGHHEESPHDSMYLQLQDAWRQTHILNWWRRFHFSTPEFQNSPFPELDAKKNPDGKDTTLWSIYRRVEIMSGLCESLSVLARATIRGWDSPSKLDLEEVADLDIELSVLRKEFETWTCAMQLSPGGFGLFPDEQPSADDLKDLLPMIFASHVEAMDFAYWAAAKVMYCAAEWTIDYVTGLQRYMTTQREVDGWIWLLLRIAAGIDWESCVRYNTHTIGMSGLLLACAIRSQRLEIGLWIENWLEERRGTAGLEEGSFPVLQILQILRIVNRERRRGFDICAVFNTTDDGGGAGKFQSYHSQVLDTIVVYERCKKTGERIRKEIPV